MASVRPSAPPGALKAELSPEEDFILTRIDRRRSVREIAEMSGLSEEYVAHVVNGLVERGALEHAPPDEPPSRAALPADESGAYTYQALDQALPEDAPTAALGDLGLPELIPLGPVTVPPQHIPGEADTTARLVPLDENGNPLEDEGQWGDQYDGALPEPEYLGPVDDSEGQPLSNEDAQRYAEAFASADGSESESSDSSEQSSTQDQFGVVEIPSQSDYPPEDQPEPLPEEEEAPKEKEPEGAEKADDEKNYRKIFESKYHKLAPDVRAGLAAKATGPDLSALCLDPDPKVIAAVMTNALFGLAHARLIAFYHRTPSGLDHVATQPQLIRDGLVFRRLIRNPQLGQATLRRILQPKRLIEIYKAAIDRELPELSRQGARGLLRSKFAAQSNPEERAELLVNTEARCLIVMTGNTIDARTTQILCGRQTYSALFVQNVARFPAAPPALLAHLAKIPFVKRNAALKKVLMQHPNMPGDVKRGM
jgi:hypothetical protein